MDEFFDSRGSLLVAGILLLAGCACFYLSWEDANSAKHEKTTVGVITDRSGGKSTSYDYRFEIDGVTLYDETGSCRTALTPKGCEVGAPVLVYYDHNSTLRTKLKEFGAVSSDELITGFCMVFGGLLIAVMHFLFKRVVGEPDESDEADEDSTSHASEELHITPKD